MAKMFGILCAGHCSIPECRAQRLVSDAERCMNRLSVERFMISRLEKSNPTGC